MRALALAVAVIALQRDVGMAFESSLAIASALVLLDDVVDDVVVELVVDLQQQPNTYTTCDISWL
jgi:hypothetical protein